MPGGCPTRFEIDCDLKLGSVAEDRVEQNEHILGGVVVQKVCDLWARYEAQGDDGIRELLRRARVVIRDTVKKAMLDLVGEECEVYLLDASSAEVGGKFSLHIHTSLLLREFSVDGFVVGRASNAAISLSLYLDSKKGSFTEEYLIGLLFMWSWRKPATDYKLLVTEGVVDVCVYRRNQLFRMYGNSKMGSTRFLCDVDGEGRVMPLGESVSERVERYTTRYEIVAFLADLELTEGEEPLTVQPCEDLYVGPSGARLLCERNESLGNFESLVDLVVIPSWEQRNELFEKGGGNEGQGSRVLVGRERVFDGRWVVAGMRDFNVAGRPNVQGSAGKEHKIVTSSYSFFGELGEAVIVTDLTHNGLTVHCPYCDCGVERQERSLFIDTGRPDGNPSAKSSQPPGGQMGVYCFSCCTFFLVCRLNEYDGFKEGATVLGTDDRRYIRATVLAQEYNAFVQEECGEKVTPFAG